MGFQGCKHCVGSQVEDDHVIDLKAVAVGVFLLGCSGVSMLAQRVLLQAKTSCTLGQLVAERNEKTFPLMYRYNSK